MQSKVSGPLDVAASAITNRLGANHLTVAGVPNYAKILDNRTVTRCSERQLDRNGESWRHAESKFTLSRRGEGGAP